MGAESSGGVKKMKLFKSSHTQWYVVVEARAEKRKLFNIIPKRNPDAIYFHPDGKRQEQFAISTEERDLINEQWKIDT